MNHLHEVKSSKNLQFYAKYMDRVQLKDCIMTYEPHLYDNIMYLVYAHKNNSTWEHMICVKAMLYGKLECLQYAYDNDICQNVWNVWICNIAIQADNKQCLRYALINGCPYDKSWINIKQWSIALLNELGL